MLDEGTIIRMEPGSEASTAEVVQVDYDDLISDVHHGDTLGFGDGAVVVEVVGNTGEALEARVIHGGEVMGRPGVHIPSDRLRIPTPTPHDLVMLDAFIEEGVDMVAVSFVRSAHDVRRVGVEPHPRGPLVIAKIETRAAVENLEGIVEASGAVMVARGDLGMEFPIEDLPHLQKEIIQRCISLGRPTITATQMLESMVHAPTPTRAEASDVANAVFDGSSALMLSGETAMGGGPGQRGGHHGPHRREGRPALRLQRLGPGPVGDAHDVGHRLRRRHHRRHVHGRLAGGAARPTPRPSSA